MQKRKTHLHADILQSELDIDLPVDVVGSAEELDSSDAQLTVVVREKNGTVHVLDKDVQDKRKKRLNKMFNTAYRTGDYEYVELPEVKVDASIMNTNFKSDPYEAMRAVELSEAIDRLWYSSRWAADDQSSLKMNKIPKKMYADLFEYFYARLKLHEYSIVEIVVAVGEYMNIPLAALYAQLSPLYQSKILEILHRETKILKHKKVFNLL